MNRIAQFSKVSFEQFLKDYNETFDYGQSEKDVEKIWGDIILPKRATKGSAGYDFVTPIGLSLRPGETIKVPTGIRCRMDEGWVLELYPRSGLGFKYGMHLNNTVGIIDGDYYSSDNEGHIFVKISNDSNENRIIILNRGRAFIQGIFVPYGITVDDDADGARNGGFGSTGR